MDGQTPEDKLEVLNTIFGNDLTQSVITNTLRENNNQFDPTVEKLLTTPANKINPPQPQPQQPAPMDGAAIENINRLHTMFGDLTQSVITTVYDTNKRDVEATVDTLLNMTSNEVATGARREAEVARQEQELRQYEEFKQVQQRLQEQERKATEAAQQRAREEEQRQKAAAEAQRKAERDKKMQDEHSKALLEQERMLLEFQRKKAAEEQQERERERKLAAEEAAKKQAVEARKAAEEAARKQLEIAERQKVEQQERARLEKEAKARALAEAKGAEEKRLLEERRTAEERLALKKLEEENVALQKQKQMAEAERKLLEARMKEELQREEEERKRFADNERRLREEQESIKRSWEEKVRKLENERRLEEQMRKEEDSRRAEAKRAEEEERARHEADMRKILELERLKLEEQRKRVEEEKRNAEERLKAMELAAKKREEEELERARLEEERKREEEEQARLLEEEKQMRERLREELSKVQAQEQFAASAIMVPPAVNEPKVQINAEVDGTEIRGSWQLLEGALPTPQAWLGLFAKRSINTYVGFMYVNGTSGDFHFKGLTPGHYEVRLFGNKLVTSRLAESTTLLIGPKVLSFSAQMQGEAIMFDYKLDPPSVPSSWDWVGIYEKTQRRNKNYLSSTYGNTTGTLQAALPRTPGEYQARLFAAGAKYNEQATVEFTVVDNDHINADLADGVIKASWVMRTVEPTSSDWIGLFAAGEQSANKYLASVYTHSTSAGTADIPLPKDISAGIYELRLFSSKIGKYSTFKVSNVVTIN